MEHLRQRHAGRAGAAARRGRRRCRPDLGQGRPRRAAVAARHRRRPHRRQPRSCTAPRPGSPSSGSRSSARWSPTSGDDFFDLGGGSLTAAQMVSRLRGALPRGHGRRPLREPDRRRAGRHARRDGRRRPCARDRRSARRRRRPRSARSSFTVPLRLLAGLRWVTWVVAGSNLGSVGARPGLPAHGLVVVGRARLGAAGRRRPAGWPLAAAGARLLLRKVGARATTRAAAGSTCGSGWPSGWPTSSVPRTSPGAAWMPTYARLLGAKVGQQRRPALDPAGHRHAHPRQRLLGRARGRPVRPLARRRRAAHRPDQGRRRRPGRHPQHARARARSSVARPRSRPGRR